MATAITLAQTLSEDWVLLIDNPEEPGTETELARFNISSTAPNTLARSVLMNAAAAAAIRFEQGLIGGKLRVTSHDSTTAMDMLNRAQAAAAARKVA